MHLRAREVVSVRKIFMNPGSLVVHVIDDPPMPRYAKEWAYSKPRPFRMYEVDAANPNEGERACCRCGADGQGVEMNEGTLTMMEDAKALRKGRG
jgi:hypothetical protein